MRITWPTLEVSVTVELADEKNPDLVGEIWDALPIRAVQEHSMVTGKSMYAWAPLVSVAPVPYTMRISDTPAGTLSYSQKTGNKIILRYGETTEDLQTPIVGFVTADDVPLLDRVGERVWSSSFHTKELIWVDFERVEA
jgi:hypothetical protein